MKAALGVAAVLLVLGVVGQSDFDEHQAQQENYCAMVKARVWPDYQGTYRKHCRSPIVAQR